MEPAVTSSITLETSDGAGRPVDYDTTPGAPIPYRAPYMHGRASQL